MKKYMAVTVTICEGSSIHGARLYYSDDELGLEIATTISYEEGMKQLRQLEKRLNKAAKLVVNQFDRSIAYKELYGFIDRE
jgi:hypothetical protein